MSLDRARIVNELNCAADDADAAAFVVMDAASWVVDLAAGADGTFVVAAVDMESIAGDSAPAFVDACNYLQSSLESQFVVNHAASYSCSCCSCLVHYCFDGHTAAAVVGGIGDHESHLVDDAMDGP